MTEVTLPASSGAIAPTNKRQIRPFGLVSVEFLMRDAPGSVCPGTPRAIERAEVHISAA